MLARGAAGPWIVTVFAPEKPPSAGKVDLSILVQNGDTGEPVRNAEIEMAIQDERITFGRRTSGNRILYSATPVLKAAGQTPVEIRIRRGREEAVLRCRLRVVSATDSTAAYVLCLAVVPAGVFLGWRNARRRGRLKM